MPLLRQKRVLIVWGSGQLPDAGERQARRLNDTR
eukprot:SAG25_NODE_5145_length_696_cov_93.860972_1_plen_33_part_01